MQVLFFLLYYIPNVVRLSKCFLKLFVDKKTLKGTFKAFNRKRLLLFKRKVELSGILPVMSHGKIICNRLNVFSG